VQVRQHARPHIEDSQSAVVIWPVANRMRRVFVVWVCHPALSCPLLSPLVVSLKEGLSFIRDFFGCSLTEVGVVVVVVRQGGEGLSDEGEGATVLTWAHTQLSQFA
jgi:hypothetical protein